MTYLFPETIYAKLNDLDTQWEHVASEFVEASREEQAGAKAAEVVDLMHSCETWLRVYERRYGVSVAATQDQVVDKNEQRGYYFNGEADKWHEENTKARRGVA